MKLPIDLSPLNLVALGRNSMIYIGAAHEAVGGNLDLTGCKDMVRRLPEEQKKKFDQLFGKI
jgi:hypothetical protein